MVMIVSCLEYRYEAPCAGVVSGTEEKGKEQEGCLIYV